MEKSEIRHAPPTAAQYSIVRFIVARIAIQLKLITQDNIPTSILSIQNKLNAQNGEVFKFIQVPDVLSEMASQAF